MPVGGHLMSAQNTLQSGNASSLPRVVCLLIALAYTGWAQSDSLDQAHVVPRHDPAPVTQASAVIGSGPNLAMRPLRVDVNLVLVPVTVTDALSRPILDLPPQEFSIYEAGVEQRIGYFSAEDSPISVAIVVDLSASMKNKVEYEAQALEQFFKNANPQDDYFVIAISSKPRMIATSEDSVGTIRDRLTLNPPTGGTALFDAAYLGVAKLRTSRYKRKAMVIISDGGDNRSRYTLKEIKSVIEEADVLTYGIGIFDDMPIPLLKTIEERAGRKWLSDITEASGGRTIAADDRRKIPEIAATVSRELRNQYVIGYSPTNRQRDGKYRKITVQLAPSATPRRVHYKEGYIAPTQ